MAGRPLDLGAKISGNMKLQTWCFIALLFFFLRRSLALEHLECKHSKEALVLPFSSIAQSCRLVLRDVAYPDSDRVCSVPGQTEQQLDYVRRQSVISSLNYVIFFPFIRRLLSVFAGKCVFVCNISKCICSHIHTLSTIFMAV